MFFLLQLLEHDKCLCLAIRPRTSVRVRRRQRLYSIHHLQHELRCLGEAEGHTDGRNPPVAMWFVPGTGVAQDLGHPQLWASGFTSSPIGDKTSDLAQSRSLKFILGFLISGCELQHVFQICVSQNWAARSVCLKTRQHVEGGCSSKT